MDRSTLAQQLKGLKAIKLDDKTTIYVKPGRDIKAIKKRYLERKNDNYKYYFDYDAGKPGVRVRRAN